jgi:chromosome segregation protein
MRIKQLEIVGFKSFVDRTVVKFDHDVMGIVGPNGCGKSNIVDALRWCIGEQSAKHLRGKSMSDVIFSGSETRGPLGMAEVTITFDNSNGELAQALPLEYRDYPEIAVTRRLHRDGTSEYAINKAQVRLKDITDLFLGTGVGTKAYSIVEQGKIGLIVSARPEDRRLLIEEAAGITKYKHRRKQAEQKMDQTRQNLARVGDIVAEIERSLASLKRQAQKAERWKAYRDEIDQLILHEASHRFLELTVLSRVEREALGEVSEAAQASKAELGAREAELEALRLRAFELEEQTEAAQKDSFSLSSAVRALEADIHRARDRLASLSVREIAAETERSDLAEQVAQVADERAQLADRLSQTDELERREIDAVMGEQEKLDEIRAQEQLASRGLNDIRARSSQVTAKVASTEAKLGASGRRLLDLQTRREKLVFDAETLRSEREELMVRRHALAEQVAELAEQKVASAELRVKLDAELKACREELVVAERELDTAKNELSQRRNRLRAIEEVQKRLEGVGVGTRQLMATKDPAILGMVADLVEAPRELTQALAGLLGDRLQDVVVTDPARGAELLAELGRAKKGRAGVVSRQLPYVAGAAMPLSSGNTDGVVGPLVERLRYAPEDEALVRALVGGALVVESTAVAMALFGKTGGPAAGRAIVALDGTVIHPDGRIVGGAADAVAAGILDQHREIRELTEIVTDKTALVASLTERHQALRNRSAELTVALDRARQEAHQSEIQHVTCEKDLRRTEDLAAGADKRVGQIETELGDVEDRLAEAADEESDARAVLDDCQEQLRAAQDELEAAEAVVNEWRERAAAQQSAVTDQKVRAARVREQSAGLRSTVERLGRSVDELMARIRKLQEELTEGARQTGAAAGTLFLARDLLGDSATMAQRAEEHLSLTRKVFEEARAELGQREQGLKDLRARSTDLTERRTKHDKELARLTIALEHLLDGVREKFRGLDLRRVVGDYHARGFVDDKHRARIVELGGLLDRMGPVNMDAVREYQEAEKRHTFYITQKTDLDAALSDLEKAIEQIDRTSRKLFKETFDSVNEKFQVMFPRMFRGGAAKLQLTSPEDMLETGVEILAQPPGKKLGNIELMSGGEKALTAVSLIFAMFQHRPSPFCVLDEVDAPLDEANVARYNEAIRSMTDQSQFILITHIKRTMQSVDVLYGVTMQEPGVSRLVSVKISESAPKRAGEAAVA